MKAVLITVSCSQPTVATVLPVFTKPLHIPFLNANQYCNLKRDTFKWKCARRPDSNFSIERMVTNISEKLVVKIPYQLVATVSGRYFPKPCMFDDAFRILLFTCHSTGIYRGGEKIMGQAKFISHIHRPKKKLPIFHSG
jgi:hypothetical protein